MSDQPDRIEQLNKKLNRLFRIQDAFNEELNELRAELTRLTAENSDPSPLPAFEKEEEEILDLVPEIQHKVVVRDGHQESSPRTKAPPNNKPPKQTKRPSSAIDFEKFIGENLFLKIGIIIIIIGVAIGAKFAIENNMISPLTRIIFGYLVGIGLLATGMKLKTKYEAYSAVLVSGAMAIMYFITFAAYSFYGLFPQIIAFGLMVIFTIFTVLAALNYNRQVIALIGLVGAYAVPFLLSNNSGQVFTLLAYVSIINIGILVIAVRKYWKSVFNVAFILTWLIYASWYVMRYDRRSDFGLALGFLIVFFLTFYGIFLAFKFVKKQKFDIGDIALLLANSFFFYGIGYATLASHNTGGQLLGVFTLANGVIHFVVSVLLHKRQLADRNLFYFVTGLVLVFITMAIPVQLDGNWVTLIWAGEAALLFWIGRSKGVSFYEKFSYPLMFLALFSIFHDWSILYNAYNPDIEGSAIRPVFNIHFLSAVLFIAAFGFINYINQNKKYPSFIADQNNPWSVMNYIIPGIFLVTLYGIFKVEIDLYWDQLYEGTRVLITDSNLSYDTYERNKDLLDFKSIWLTNFSLFFFSILSFINIKKLKNQTLGYGNLAINVLLIFAFLSAGLFIISELRESYLAPSEFFQTGTMHLAIRYISLLFIGLMLFATYAYTRSDFLNIDLKIPFELLLHLSILWVTGSELLHWMDIAGSDQSYKLGLSILWGAYALLLVSLGIWKHKKHLRIAAIALFAVTLAKLFLYDIGNLSTIAKTVVLVSLGVLLLIISFLYNKFQDDITEDGVR